MSVIIKSGQSGWYMDLKAWLDFELTLDILADASEYVGENPSEFTATLGKTINADINGTTLEYEIVDLGRYDKADGSGKAGFVLMPKTQILTTHHMNASATTSGGWASTEMRSWLNGLTRPSRAVQVRVPYVNGTGTTVSYANDYLFLPSYGELFGKYSSGNRSVEGDIFAGATNSSAWRIRYEGTTAKYYWLRSVYDSDSFWIVGSNGGTALNYSADGVYGVVPCFCI